MLYPVPVDVIEPLTPEALLIIGLDDAKTELRLLLVKPVGAGRTVAAVVVGPFTPNALEVGPDDTEAIVLLFDEPTEEAVAGTVTICS